MSSLFTLRILIIWKPTSAVTQKDAVTIGDESRPNKISKKKTTIGNHNQLLQLYDDDVTQYISSAFAWLIFLITHRHAKQRHRIPKLMMLLKNYNDSGRRKSNERRYDDDDEESFFACHIKYLRRVTRFFTMTRPHLVVSVSSYLKPPLLKSICDSLLEANQSVMSQHANDP